MKTLALYLYLYSFCGIFGGIAMADQQEVQVGCQDTHHQQCQSNTEYVLALVKDGFLIGGITGAASITLLGFLVVPYAKLHHHFNRSIQDVDRRLQMLIQQSYITQSESENIKNISGYSGSDALYYCCFREYYDAFVRV